VIPYRKTKRGIGPELSQMAGMQPVGFFAEAIINPEAVVGPHRRRRKIEDAGLRQHSDSKTSR